MANAFRSFLEKLGLVAPESPAPAAAPVAAPSSEPTPPAPQPEPEQAPEPTPAPIEAPEAEKPQEESAPQCNMDHTDCANDPKGCCSLSAPHDGMQHECGTCKQSF